MKELLEKINETFDNSINTANDEVALQLRILKGNINTLFNEAMESSSESAPGVFTNTLDSVSDKKNVLIVDDSSIIRNYLQKAISDNYNVTLAGGGEEAINTINSSKIDLIFLDLMMPGVDGFEVLEYMKNNNIIIPVVIISGDTTKETIDRAFTYKVYDMIEKPFSDKVILEKIARILE